MLLLGPLVDSDMLLDSYMLTWGHTQNAPRAIVGASKYHADSLSLGITVLFVGNHRARAADSSYKRVGRWRRAAQAHPGPQNILTFVLTAHPEPQNVLTFVLTSRQTWVRSRLLHCALSQRQVILPG